MVRLSLIPVHRSEACSGCVHAIRTDHRIDVSRQKEVAEFMADAESLVPFVSKVRGVHDAEGISDFDEKSGNPGASITLRLNHNVVTRGDGDRIDW